MLGHLRSAYPEIPVVLLTAHGSVDAAVEAILSDRVQEGDVVLIRYEGPKGGPGMQEMLYPTSYLKSKGLGAALKRLAASFRSLPVPVIGRIQDDAFWLDLRCLEPDTEAAFLAQLDGL